MEYLGQTDTAIFQSPRNMQIYNGSVGSKSLTDFYPSPAPLQRSFTTLAWKPATYYQTSRVNNNNISITNSTANPMSTRASLTELEGLKVPSIFSSARNALYTRYTPNDWVRAAQVNFDVSSNVRNNAEKIRSDSVRLAREFDDRTKRAQEDSGKKLGDRVGDIHYMRTEVNDEIDKMMTETEALANAKRAAEKVLSETENPLHVTQECLYNREKRDGIDLVHDMVEKNLLEEVDLIKRCQDQIADMIRKANVQLNLNRAAQHELEKDSHDKFQAEQIDTYAQGLKNSSAGIAYYNGVENIDNCISTPETWLKFTNNNLQRSAAERDASRRLREDIELCLTQCQRDMAKRWADVNAALAQRAQETSDARNKIQEHLNKISTIHTVLKLIMIAYYWLFIGLIFQYISNVHSAEYSIVSDKVPIYLYRKFNVVEEVFPNDITVLVSFSKIRGTLLYSIDKHMNQLIVKMIDNIPYTLSVELNGRIILLSLSKLCGCVWCRYEILRLRFQINYYISIQCNGREVRYFKKYFSNQNTINKDYPIVYSESKPDINVTNEAHLWLINTPQYGDVYPNPLQMTGCIFKVEYKGDDIIFTNQTKNIGNKCSPICTESICNGGQCLETYDIQPVCNCTATFKNGLYCNDSITRQNIRAVSQHYRFELLKLSWMSSANELFVLGNENNELIISRNQSRLFLRVSCLNVDGFKLIVSGTITEVYNPNDPYIIILHFTYKNIDLKLMRHRSWTSIQIPLINDLTRGFFTSLTLRSDKGFIDLVQKSSQDFYWINVYTEKHEDIAYETDGRQSNTNIKNCDHNSETEDRQSNTNIKNSDHNSGYLKSQAVIYIGLPIIIIVVIASIVVVLYIILSR